MLRNVLFKESKEATPLQKAKFHENNKIEQSVTF